MASVACRNVKNLVCNYTEAQVKVREATRNEVGCADTDLLMEVAVMSRDVDRLPEIMEMILTRLRDQRVWIHVWKSLVLLEKMIKFGSKQVKHHCIENIYEIQKLLDYKCIVHNMDRGIGVRDKAHELLVLLYWGDDDSEINNNRSDHSEVNNSMSENILMNKYKTEYDEELDFTLQTPKERECLTGETGMDLIDLDREVGLTATNTEIRDLIDFDTEVIEVVAEEETTRIYPSLDSLQTPDNHNIPNSLQTPDNHNIPHRLQTPDNHNIPHRLQTPDNHNIPNRLQTPDNHNIPHRLQTPDNHNIPHRFQTSDNHNIPNRFQTPDNHNIPHRLQTPDSLHLTPYSLDIPFTPPYNPNYEVVILDPRPIIIDTAPSAPTLDLLLSRTQYPPAISSQLEHKLKQQPSASVSSKPPIPPKPSILKLQPQLKPTTRVTTVPPLAISAQFPKPTAPISVLTPPPPPPPPPPPSSETKSIKLPPTTTTTPTTTRTRLSPPLTKTTSAASMMSSLMNEIEEAGRKKGKGLKPVVLMEEDKKAPSSPGIRHSRGDITGGGVIWDAIRARIDSINPDDREGGNEGDDDDEWPEYETA